MISRNGSESSKEEVQGETEVQEQPIQLMGNLSVQRSHRVQKFETSKKWKRRVGRGTRVTLFLNSPMKLQTI